MRNLKLNQMENLEGGTIPNWVCAATGFLLVGANQVGGSWGSIANTYAGICLNS